MAGLRAESASWETSPMPEPRTVRICRGVSVVRFLPSKVTRPEISTPHGGEHPQDRQHGLALAAAGLADDAE